MAHFNKKSFLILDRKWILSYERHYKSLFYTVFIYLFVNLVIGISFSWRFLEKFISRAPSSDCCGVIVDTLGKFEIMTRVILIPYDLVTPFDLEGQTFMVYMEFSTYYHERKSWVSSKFKFWLRIYLDTQASSNGINPNRISNCTRDLLVSTFILFYFLRKTKRKNENSKK